MAELSKLEKKVLDKLYEHYKDSGKRVKYPIPEIFSDLDIKDGSYVGTLNDSEFITLVLKGTQECFEISNEGIRFMESLGDQKLHKNSKSRRQILDRDLKMLWGNSGSTCAICRKVLVHDKVDSDPHVVVGVASHIVADSINGPRGVSDLPLEKRHLYDNLILLCMEHSKIIDEQLQKYTVDELKRIKKEHEVWVRKRLSATDEIITDTSEIPVLDVIYPISPSGGPSGHFADFEVMNIGEKVAINCSWGIKGFGYEWESSPQERFMLTPSAHATLRYSISEQPTFLEEIPELFAFFKYQDNKDNHYMTRRDLFQRKVPSGAFYELILGDFSPAVRISDDIIVSIGDLYHVDQTLLWACDFEINLNGETKVVTISLGHMSIKAWDLSTPEKVKAAITELGTKMIRSGNLENHIITSDDFDTTKITQGGFEGYKQARDSI